MSFLPINLLNVQPATGFDYPQGKYLFQVETTDIRANTDGEGQRLLVNNVIIMGPGAGNTQYQGRKLANSYQLSEKGAPFLKRFFLVCGITDEFIAANGGQVDPEWLHGKQFVASVVKNGQYTNITNEKPASDWNAVEAPKTAAPTAAAPPSLLQPNPVQQQQPAAYVQPQMQPQPQYPQPMQQPMQQPQMQPQPQYPQPQMQPGPQGLPTPTLPQPQQGGIPVGIPAPVPPPGNVGNR